MLVYDVNHYFHFQPHYYACPTLEIKINLMLDSDINLIFIFNVGFGLLNANFVEHTSLYIG